MANFTHKTFVTHDDYMTPKSAWEDIKEYIPQDKFIWEAFYGDGKSGDYLKEMGFNVVHEQIDFHEYNLGDIIISNPPYDRKLLPPILKRLKALDKPFIMIMPVSKITTNYFKELFKDEIQLIIPKHNRICFKKMNEEGQGVPNFSTFYYCYKMNLPRDIVWL